ncbi:MAG: hypothetical protein R6W90_07570 [Ignavibacteriaceae bacterium]
MARSRPGIKQLVLCDAGTLLTTPVNPIAAGLRNAASIKRTAYKPVKDYLNRSFRNKVNFNIQAESLQPTMLMRKKAIDWLNQNVDVQVVTVPQASGGTGDVYQFTGNNVMGLDFEDVISGDKRSMKLTLERAMEYDAAKTFIDAVDSAAAVPFSGITGRGEDLTKFRSPYFLAFESPAAATVLTKAEIAERSYTIKTKNKKSEEDNTSIVDYLSFEVMMKFRNASVAKQVEVMSKDNAPSLLIKENNRGLFYDAFNFAPGVLTLEDEFDDTDDDRGLTLKFTGDVHVYDISFQFGTAYGGDETDGGTKGGTMNIG